MSTTTLLGILSFNARGAAWFGIDHTSIALSFEDHVAYGLTWNMRWLTRGGDWLHFANSGQCSSATDRAHFLAVVNSITNNNTPNLDAYVGAIAPWVASEIQREFGEYIGAGIAPPPKLPAGAVTAANIVDAIALTAANDFILITGASGVPAFAHR